jgi:protein-S-isoprenylcysteine O-methyltransferase Ste14
MPRAIRVLATLAIGLAIFGGLPILGWGLTDVRGFLAHPARLSYLVLVLLLNTAISIRRPEVGKKREEGVKTVPRQRWAVALLQVTSLASVIAGPFCDRREIAVIHGGEPVRYVGLALYVAGLLLMHLAQTALGRQFSIQVTIQEGHRLVTDGLYRHVRHPRYLGTMLFASGLALVFRSWVAVALCGAICLILAWRIRDEEALLRREFGAEWDAYARRSRRLIPFVY